MTPNQNPASSDSHEPEAAAPEAPGRTDSCACRTGLCPGVLLAGLALGAMVLIEVGRWLIETFFQ